jgi:hypothetical protein
MKTIAEAGQDVVAGNEHPVEALTEKKVASEPLLTPK